ncbi:MAG: efflux RND transporter periplasmic adaptor subunit [Deltaproteobacteria bacterium]|nr:efflux RND transporter periplasmic adaptor subunit [Deltaproteobacteria bacterium]
MTAARELRLGGIGAAAAIVLVASLLAVQHYRHGWPFSLHHGLPPIGEHTGHSPASDGDAAVEEAAHPRAAVHIDPSRLAAFGIRTEPARRESLSRSFRAVATVTPDEARISHVHTRVSGWIERLYVPTTGAKVRSGQALAAIFSRELLSSQTEYLAVRRAAAGGGASSGLVEGARARLRVLGMSDSEIATIEQRGTPMRLVTVSSPRRGVVLERGVTVGAAVDASTEIATIADLSRVWIVAEIAEADIPEVQVGTQATLEIPASAREPFVARAELVYPTLSDRTRTLRIRFAADNADGRLRPGMYGTAAFETVSRDVLTLPRDAVVDTGLGRHVFVAAADGTFEPHAVRVGASRGDRLEITEGVREGEAVVVSGVFLVDSESRLQASGGTGHQHGGGSGESAQDGGPAAPAARPRRPQSNPIPPRQTPSSAPVETRSVPAPSVSTPRPPPARPAPSQPARSTGHAGHGG